MRDAFSRVHGGEEEEEDDVTLKNYLPSKLTISVKSSVTALHLHTLSVA